MLAGVEAGGTKFVCAIGDENGKIMDQIQIPTTVPEETIQHVINFIRKHPIRTIGIGSFGPVDVAPESATYGYITSTPKSAWRNYPLVQTLKSAFPIPIGFNTDVNAAALGEATLGAAKGLDSCLYITIGTGIGAGAIVNGTLLQGLTHPEMGHIIVRRHPKDTYRGKCPYHLDCLEGLASGPAIKERWGEKGENLLNNKNVWELEAFYIAQALMQYILILSPKKIILGGGVMKQDQVFKFVYQNLQKFLNGYIPLPELQEYIVKPGLGDNAGVIGSLLLGKQALIKK